MDILSIILIMGAYLLGSIPAGLWVAKSLRGIDPRQSGSGNVGATNVLRVAGKKEAALTLAADILKGFLPVMMAQFLKIEPRLVLFVGFSAILGHVFPVFLRFKGGKGVAVSLGVFFGIAPVIALLALMIWLGAVYGWRYSSVGALAAFGALPLLTLWLKPTLDFMIFSLLLSALVYFRHRDNIRRLLQGTEKRAIRS